MALHPLLCLSFLRFLLTFSISTDQYIKHWQSLAPKSENIYLPSDLFLTVGLFLYCQQHTSFSLSFQVKPVQGGNVAEWVRTLVL